MRCEPRASPTPAPKRLSISSPAPARTRASLASPPRAGSRPNCARGCPRKVSQLDEPIQNLHIKISGCFNSCGQHHVADLGFYGVSRKIAGYAVPHFQVVLGGEWTHNAGSYGLPVVAIPSKNIPEVVTRLTEKFVAGRTKGETFKDFVKRVGKVQLKAELEDLARPPADPVGSIAVQRLGRSPRIHAGRHGRRRMRRRSGLRRGIRSRRSRARSLRGASRI